MKYNQALDILAASAEYARVGKTTQAAKLFMAAVKHPQIASAIALIDHNNQKAHDALQASKAKAEKASKVPPLGSIKRLLTASDFDSDLDQDIAGEELKVEVDDEESMPEVQEGSSMEEAKFRRIIHNLT